MVSLFKPIHAISELDLDNNPFLYQAVKDDYDLVRNTLLNNHQDLKSLTGKMGKYIQPRTKGRDTDRFLVHFMLANVFWKKLLNCNLSGSLKKDYY